MTDFLGLEDAGEQRAALGPAFIPPPRAGQRELVVMEQMVRASARDFPGAAEVLFTADDDEGSEIWDPPVAPDFIDEAKRWQAIMRWPRPPTIAEAQAFQANQRTACLAAWWDRLAAARAEDDAERPEPPRTKTRQAGS